jgi:hypothetical protein
MPKLSVVGDAVVVYETTEVKVVGNNVLSPVGAQGSDNPSNLGSIFKQGSVNLCFNTS